MDSVAARDFWNSRYDRQDYLFGETPNAFLAAQIARLQPGMTALAVADGEGRNGVWLAEQGLTVTTTDIAPRAIEKALALAGIASADLKAVVPHQANVRIISAIAEKLAIPMDKVVLNLDRYGNTTAASIPLALEEAVRGGRIQDGDFILLVAFGAGLTWGATVIQWGR